MYNTESHCLYSDNIWRKSEM